MKLIPVKEEAEEAKFCIRLLPCPFCGDKAWLYKNEGGILSWQNWTVSCTNLMGCAVAPFVTDAEIEWSVKSWNTRP